MKPRPAESVERSENEALVRPPLCLDPGESCTFKHSAESLVAEVSEESLGPLEATIDEVHILSIRPSACATSTPSYPRAPRPYTPSTRLSPKFTGGSSRQPRSHRRPASSSLRLGAPQSREYALPASPWAFFGRVRGREAAETGPSAVGVMLPRRSRWRGYRPASSERRRCSSL